MKIRYVSLFLIAGFLQAQVLTWSPQFATRSDTITIVYDATGGNAGLTGATEVYAHTGVITNLSSNSTDWRYVKTSWGQNTADTRLTSLGGDRWLLKMHIESYYGVPAGETIEQLAFVFRNGSASRAGRAADGGDLFIPVYLEGLQVAVISPAETPLFGDVGDTLHVTAVGSNASRMSISVNSVDIFETDGDSLSCTLTASAAGRQEVRVSAFDATNARKETTFDWVINPDITIAPLPESVRDGITVTGAAEAVLALYAPRKEFVYVIGSFNEWKCGLDGFMHLTPDSSRWWLTLSGLDPDSLYRFQYLVDGRIKIADPYAELILDPWYDSNIPESVYPGLPSYPAGKTTEAVGVFTTAPDTFAWTDASYEPPEKTNLVIYELLIRDFLAAHDYATLIDTLDYLERLGVSAVELMPVNEFEGNSSWGYNPSFYFAPDKFYGPARDLKRFVNEAHRRGMAVILDMVLNHAYGECPLVRLYWDGANNRPAAENPWFNAVSPNPVYSWGNDFNHESEATRAFCDRVLAYWVERFHIDGYRLDFTKGFTNRYGDGWSYDAGRISILKRLADQLWNIDPECRIILEHFCENSEEMELVTHGMMIWGNMNTAYSQSSMGWLNDSQRPSGLSGGYYKARGWPEPGLVTYMESHDEPWLIYKNLQYGRFGNGYSIRDLDTALERYALAAAFFLTLPGPKMMWQFGELGYDEYLPEAGLERVAPKPLHWEYFQERNRRRLYDTIAALNRLRRKHALFRDGSTTVTMRAGQNQYDRWIHLANDTMRATVIGNFDIVSRGLTPVFQHSGMWYDYFAGDSLEITAPNVELVLQPGEFRIYLDRAETRPLLTGVDDPGPGTDTGMPADCELYQNYPNPFNGSTVISYRLGRECDVTVDVLNLRGQVVAVPVSGVRAAGVHQVSWGGRNDAGARLASGVYFVRLRQGRQLRTAKMILLQ
ncbi:T9SS type A sorting domain-containing protein [bacterium]|nr:T9SS type A sorting domain-containing protein [bacterium]